MNKFKKFIAVMLFIVGIAVLAYYKAKSDLVVKQKEQAILDYYQNVENNMINKMDNNINEAINEGASLIEQVEVSR